LIQKSRTSTVTLRTSGEIRSTDEKVLARQKLEMREPLATRNPAAFSPAFAAMIISHPAGKISSSN